jgi:hypothetical protein
MLTTESILTEQYQQQDFQSIAKKDDAINNRSAPYIALAMGLYENTDNLIQFAIKHLDQIDNLEILKVYNALEIYAYRLGAQQVITLPELARFYGIAKKLSDEKIATAVLTSLAARHLAFKSDISHWQECHINDAKNIITSTKTYFKQEAAIDAMVYMVSSLCRAPDNYQLAANQGKKAELKKLAGAKIFPASSQDKVNHIRLLLIAAQDIALQVEEKGLDDAYIIFTIKQELLKQGVDEELADAVTIVCGASYFFEENYSIPKQSHLEQAAEWLAKSSAIIHCRANQAAAIKLLQEYLKPNFQLSQGIAASEQLKQDVLSGNSIEGKIKAKGRVAELSWKAFSLAQDYGANYYFSMTDGAFQIERNTNGNGLYDAVHKALQTALVDDLDNPIHNLTAEQLSTNIRKMLPDAKGIIVEQFNDIIRNNASVLSVPPVFSSELKVLQQNWQNYEKLSDLEQKALQRDITAYLANISTYYIAFANNNPNIGCDIELNIIAHYYGVQIKQHSHLTDDYKVINQKAKPTAHIFYSLHQSCYYNLVAQKNLNSQDFKISPSTYIEQAAIAVKQAPKAGYLDVAMGILASSNHLVWQPSKTLAPESLQQAIDYAYNKLNDAVSNKQHNAQVSRDTQPKQILAVQDYYLPLPLRVPEQLSIITKEAELSIANIQATALKTTEATKHCSDARIALYSARSSANLKERSDMRLELRKEINLEILKALAVANLEAYKEWWRNVVREQRIAIEAAYSATDQQINQYISELTKAYEQKLTEIDNHYAAVLNKAIQDYNYHQKCVAEAQRTAKRKRRQKMIRSFAGMAIAAFVAPVLAQSMFAAGTFSCAVATGAIAGGISSGIAGNNVFKGAAMGGLFAGFGFGVDQALGKFIESSDLLRSSLNVAATASLSSAIHGGKLLDNVLASVGANVAASLIVPMPKFADNKNLTKPQINAINNRQVIRAFTRGMTASVISKDHNLGMSLINAGMSGLQTWADHKANMYTQERRASQQQSPIRNTNRPMIFSNKQATRPTPKFNSARANNVNRSSTGGGRVGGYKINLPEIEHPCASAFRRGILVNEQPLTNPAPTSAWQRFKENYTAVTNDMDTTESLMYSSQSKEMAKLYDKYNVGTRIGSGIQAGFGVGQLSLAIALAETGIGTVPACLLAARGADNLIAGAMGFITGQDKPTILHQAIRGVGLSDTTAMWVEFGADLSPAVPTMARNAVDLYKTGVLKLYDVSRAKNLKWFEPRYVSSGGFRNELPLTPAQKQEALDYALSLGVSKEAIYFTDTSPTSYKILFGQKEILYIGTDVLPNASKTSIANSRVTMRGAIAHEIIGHRTAELANMTHPNAILEEAQASIRAARFAGGLTNIERTILLRDGVERLRNAGYKVADVKHELWINEALKSQLTPR